MAHNLIPTEWTLIVSQVASEVEKNMLPTLLSSITKLSGEASKQSYYRFNGMWTRQMQDAVSYEISLLVLVLTHITGIRNRSLRVAGRIWQARRRAAVDHRGGWLNLARYPPSLRTRLFETMTDSRALQYLSTSRIEMPSISQLKNTYKRSCPSLMSWYALSLSLSLSGYFQGRPLTDVFRRASLVTRSRLGTTSVRCSSASSSRISLPAFSF